MIVYLGETKVTIRQGNKSYKAINTESIIPPGVGTLLMSLDNYLLADVQDVYLIPKEDD